MFSMCNLAGFANTLGYFPYHLKIPCRSEAGDIHLVFQAWRIF